jgi:hypothetical protein
LERTSRLYRGRRLPCRCCWTPQQRFGDPPTRRASPSSSLWLRGPACERRNTDANRDIAAAGW